jgi:FkbM family methyltransferase
MLTKLTRNLYKILGSENSTILAHSKVGRLAYSILNRRKGDSIYKVDLGIKLKLTKYEAMFMGLYYLGQLNPFESEYIKQNVKRGDVFIDVGTFIDGWHSLLAAQLGAKVIAFEPVKEYVSRFEEQVKLNHSNIKIEAVALSDKDGKTTFYDSGGASSFSKKHGEKINKYPSRKITVVTKKLDSYKLKPTLIKIDVEGFEMNVLKGAQKTLAKYKPTLILELEDKFLREAGSSTAELLSYLGSLGYIFWMFSKNGTLLPYDGAKKTGMNVICEAVKE